LADELDRYLATHTVPQAAKRWQVNERTIRKWRARADAPIASVLAQDERTAPTTIDNAPTFVPTSDDVAGCGTMWLDPWSKELMPVVPGTHRKVFEAERIAAMERHKAAVHAALNLAPIGPPLDTMSSQDDAVNADPVSTDVPDPDQAHDEGPDFDAAFKALQSRESSAPDTRLDSDRVTARPSAPVIIRERVVYRERERVEVGLIGWVREHPGVAHQAVAWLIAAVLIGVASLG
jgi:hypothetical protein